MPTHFSTKEMQARRKAVVTRLDELGLDGLLMFKQESMYYLTGYDSFGFSLFQCLVIDSDGNTALLTRLPDLRQARYTSDIKDIRLWHDVEGVNPALELLGMLEDLGFQRGTLGIEFDSYGLKAQSWRLLEPVLANFCTLTDASTLIDRFRAVKSPKEIEYIRKAAALSDDAWDEAVQHAEPGAFEGDILAAMQGIVFRGDGDYAGNEFIIGSGPSALLVRYHSGKRNLDDQDQLTLEWSAAYRRYHAAMMRTLIVGTIHREHQNMYQACKDALLACEAVIYPGRPMGDVYQAHAEVLDAAGFGEHRMRACGYGMSAIYNPLWVDPPMFYEGNSQLMEAGNTFFLHMILANSNPARAMTLGHTVLITESGCERLSRSSLDLVVK